MSECSHGLQPLSVEELVSGREIKDNQQDETVEEVSLAFAGGLLRCLGDALR